MLCCVGLFPGLITPDGMHRLEAEFISLDLHSFLECQTASAFPATEVIGSEGLGCCKQEHLRQGVPRDRGVSCGMTLIWDLSWTVTCMSSCVSGARDMLGAICTRP